MKDLKLRYSAELLNEINDLKNRALKVGYKNVIPKMPETIFNSDQSMAGFRYRLDNWKKQLVQLENPGGLPSAQPSNIITRQIVINDIKNLILDDDFTVED